MPKVNTNATVLKTIVSAFECIPKKDELIFGLLPPVKMNFQNLKRFLNFFEKVPLSKPTCEAASRLKIGSHNV